jgi:hypothetical protein
LEQIAPLIHAQQQAIVRLAEHLDRLAQVIETDRKHSLDKPNGKRLPEPIAIELTQAGVELPKLLRDCGLAPAEAEFLLEMHARRPAQKTVNQIA